MYNPKDILTEDGLEEHMVHIFNLKRAIFWLTNNADDLHIDALHEDHLSTIYEMERLLQSKILEEGDGEEYEGKWLR